MEGADLKSTIVFSTSRDWVSRAIRWITRSPCSHVALIYDDCTFDIRCVMQSWWSGFELRTLQQWNQGNRVVAEYKVLNHDVNDSVKKLARHLGEGYEFGHIPLLAIKSWMEKWMKLKFSIRPSRTPKKMICSEAITRFLQWSNVEAVKELDPEITSPADLLCVVSRSDEFQKVE